MTKSVYVITPSIGSKHLDRCILSVKTQTYTDVKHIVVLDGVCLLDEHSSVFDGVTIIRLPFNTGAGGISVDLSTTQYAVYFVMDILHS
ncbi:hypothetical protein B0D95_10780 [Cellvibrio sp. PSBB023]|nr:hypothetical protein B0D95_10780 [Cellvibrio sp. PSBB023]